MSSVSADHRIALGIDVGGTFTDVLALERASGRILAAFKLPSTPDDPAIAAIEGVDRYHERGGEPARSVSHGTTVGTNALIQKKAAKTALLTTAGFRDVLALRRQARPRLYDLSPVVSVPLAPRERRIEVAERMAHDGTVVTPLEADEIARVVAALKATAPQAVAIALLHCYANDEHERRLGEAVAAALPEVFVTLSSDVCREFREFERTSTVTVNAYIGPVVRDYVGNLGAELAARDVPRLAIVKSNGGLTSAENAARYPVHLIESGPAAGVVSAAALARAEGLDRVIAFDMGGTTAKAGVVICGQPRLSTEFYADKFVGGVDVGGYPIQSPVIDLIEVGAGGGSIARVDSAGVLKVGPESAGAMPGPAAYGRGGGAATVTDAHVALGHIAADSFASDDLTLAPKHAATAIETHIARPLGWTPARAAHGILTIANANMAELVRLATLRRGLDPRDFTLIAFGGAGPLHAGEIAREVGVPRIIVPPYPGLFSAIGALLAEVRHDLVQTLLATTDRVGPADLRAAFDALAARARALLAADDVDTAIARFERFVDLRFEGQLFELTLPLPTEETTGAAIDAAFRARYVASYGYDLPGHPVELVNVRLIASAGETGDWPAGNVADATARTVRQREIIDSNGTARAVTVYPRAAIAPGDRVDGPAIVEDIGATIRLLDGQTATARPSGVLVIEERG